MKLQHYSAAGPTNITYSEIENYCSIAKKLKDTYKQKEKFADANLENEFRKLIVKTNDELIIAKLSGGPLHSIFEKTILYLIQKNGALSTIELHGLIQEIHPDLCDDYEDRVINGVRFGKKWKHAVRTAQQHLKKKKLVDLESGRWQLLF